MKIDGIRTWQNKQGETQYEVMSLYERDGITGLWALSGRWIGQEPPVLGDSVRYMQGKYGFIAYPCTRS